MNHSGSTTQMFSITLSELTVLQKNYFAKLDGNNFFSQLVAPFGNKTPSPLNG
jgi:hypothetical protein